jgi:hypothetical protein
LADRWEVTDDDIARLTLQGFGIMKTSAKTGHGIDAAFLSLTEAML